MGGGRNALRRKALAAGAVRSRIRVRYFESAFLQIVAVIEYGAADKQRALRIDHDANSLRIDEDIAVRGTIDQIHFVLKARAAASDYRDSKRTIDAALALQQRGKFCPCVFGEL